MTLADRIRALADLNVPALRDLYNTTTDRSSRSDNRVALTRGLVRAWTKQEPPQGRNEQRSVHRALQHALAPRTATTAPPPDPRLPPVGTVIRRPYGDRDIEVRVTRDGFDFEGRSYASLSAIAREVTGNRWNGLLFFGLRPRQRGEATR